MKAVEQSLAIPVAGVTLEADVVVPADARGVVLFAHGSGSGRHSPRNRYVAGELQNARLATILADLLTREEEILDARTAELRFDVDLLGERLIALTAWAQEHEPIGHLNVGLFGASTGAAAALIAAAKRPDPVKVVVSRGGRPDLAGDALRSVRQSTLLIVGQRDPLVIRLNQQAMELLAGEKRLVIVPGATHLFEEPGALEQVARLAKDWIVEKL